MAKYVGLTVLHPGGLKATDELANKCKIDRDTKVIDIACGKGTTAIYLAQKYNCHVIGIDISCDLIEQARKLAKNKGVEKLVEFNLGDALDLPYPDSYFDVAISQAMLILVDNKVKAIQEAVRVIKQGGFAGWIELSWKSPPTEEFMKKVTDEMCAFCMENVSTFDDWKSIFKEAGIKNIIIQKNSMEFNGMKGMLSDEGFKNSMSVMFNYISNSRIRDRMKKLNNFILTNPEFFGYGLFLFNK